MNHEQIDWSLIRKRIDSCLTDEEEDRLDRWMEGGENRRRFVEHACRYYRRELPVIDETRITKAWQQFRNNREEIRGKQFFTRWMWTAVAVVLSVTATWLGLQRADVNKGEVLQQEIAIGDHRARLIISDGTEIDLASGNSEQAIVDNGVSMVVNRESLYYEENNASENTCYHTLEVPHGGEFQLTLSDGSRVWLNAESRLVYPMVFGKTERRVRLEGEAYFEVKPGKGSFVVETGSMSVRVLGTAFNVNAYNDETMVRTTLVHGKVEVWTVEDSLYRALVPGDQAMLDVKTGQLKVEQVNTDLYTRWTKGQFVFRNTPLQDIMRTLAHWYEMDYEFTDPELETLCFYGVISRFEHVESLLDQFEKTGKVHFEYQGNKITVKK